MKGIPDYDILITNPPYSGEHKQKLLQYLLNATSRNSDKRKPYALLLPAYTATKSYWKEFIADLEKQPNLSTNLNSDTSAIITSSSAINLNPNPSATTSSSDVLYLLPPDSYQYRHPEGTGKDTPPFFSAWFMGGFTDSNSVRSALSKPFTRVLTSVGDMILAGVATDKRLGVRVRVRF
jgi:hypothetical protein